MCWGTHCSDGLNDDARRRGHARADAVTLHLALRGEKSPWVHRALREHNSRWFGQQLADVVVKLGAREGLSAELGLMPAVGCCVGVTGVGSGGRVGRHEGEVARGDGGDWRGDCAVVFEVAGRVDLDLRGSHVGLGGGGATLA